MAPRRKVGEEPRLNGIMKWPLVCRVKTLVFQQREYAPGAGERDNMVAAHNEPHARA